MNKALLFPIILSACFLFAAPGSGAQSADGSLDFLARITPTAARPEPVRQFTFYVLTKSYREICKDVQEKDAPPDREAFVSKLAVSPELKEWLKKHSVLDLTAPDLDHVLTPEEILNVPEFLAAYQRTNSGGVTKGLPRPRYTDADKADHPERYQKLHDEYFASLKKFIQSHPESVSGIELELSGVNPQPKWAQLQSAQKKRVGRFAPEIAQTKYLVAQADTDLEGRGSISNLPPGKYWISTLSLEAVAGDARLRWDVPITVEAGRDTRIDLTNLNATDAPSSTP